MRAVRTWAVNLTEIVFKTRLQYENIIKSYFALSQLPICRPLPPHPLRKVEVGLGTAPTRSPPWRGLGCKAPTKDVIQKTKGSLIKLPVY